MFSLLILPNDLFHSIYKLHATFLPGFCRNKPIGTKLLLQLNKTNLQNSQTTHHFAVFPFANHEIIGSLGNRASDGKLFVARFGRGWVGDVYVKGFGRLGFH